MLKLRETPTGMDYNLQQAQKFLYRELVKLWGEEVLYQCYGRCYRNPAEGGHMAQVYIGENQYTEAYWDDAYDAVSFFGVSSDETKPRALHVVGVHLVFFVNLKKLKDGLYDRRDETLRYEVQKVLGKNSYGLTFRSIETGIQNVLREYPGTRRNETLKQVDMHPVHAFRLNYTLRYNPYAVGSEKLDDVTGVANWTGFTYEPLTGDLTFTGSTIVEGTRTRTSFRNPDGTAYVNGEGSGYSVGPIDGDTMEGLGAHFTVGQVLIKWQRIKDIHPDYPELTGWNEKLLTVTRLARRWLRIWNLSTNWELMDGFAPVKVHNVAGAISGTATTVSEIISVWNADPVNAAFGQIIAQSQFPVSGPAEYYLLQIEPVADALIYPVGKINVEWAV